MGAIERITELLQEKGWSKYKLAKEADLPQSTITSLMSGRVKNPSAESLTKIANALGTSASDLLGESWDGDIPVSFRNYMRTKLHDDFVEAIDVINNLEKYISDRPNYVKNIEKSYQVLLNSKNLNRVSLYNLYNEIFSMDTLSDTFLTFHSLLEEILDLKNSNEKKNSDPLGNEKEFFENVLEMTDEDIKKKFEFFSIDGEPLTSEEFERMIAAVRAERLYRNK